MRRILAPILRLFPSLARGETVKWGENLVYREGLFYKKSTDVPFTGKVTGKAQGSVRNGKRDGPWVYYLDNGKLLFKGTGKDGKLVGPLVSYNRERGTGSISTIEHDLEMDTPPQAQEKERKCLHCRDEFTSRWYGERVCRRCKSNSFWRGSVEAFLEL
jgi:hypothetical protein